jgi:hypothetical protein
VPEPVHDFQVRADLVIVRHRNGARHDCASHGRTLGIVSLLGGGIG